jgi:hypothetical protein
MPCIKLLVLVCPNIVYDELQAPLLAHRIHEASELRRIAGSKVAHRFRAFLADVEIRNYFENFGTHDPPRRYLFGVETQQAHCPSPPSKREYFWDAEIGETAGLRLWPLDVQR